MTMEVHYENWSWNISIKNWSKFIFIHKFTNQGEAIYKFLPFYCYYYVIILQHTPISHLFYEWTKWIQAGYSKCFGKSLHC